MKRRKLYLSIIPFLMFFAFLLITPVKAVAYTGITVDNAPTSGVVGTCKWTFDRKTGDLRISCKTKGVDGVMPDFENWHNAEYYDSDTHQWLPSDLPWRIFEDEIQRIIVGNGVTYIGEGAFADLGSKENPIYVSLPQNSLEISGDVFWMTYLNSINLDYVTKIKWGAFEDAVFTKTTLSIRATEIEKRAFMNTNIRKVTLKNSVKIIGDEAFADCPNLQEVSIGTGVKTIGDKAFYGMARGKRDYPLYGIYVGSNVESIGVWAFGYYGENYHYQDPDFIMLTEEGSAADEYAQSNDIKVWHGQLFFTDHDFAHWVFDKDTGTLYLSCNNSYVYDRVGTDVASEMEYPTPDAANKYWTNFIDEWGLEVFHVTICVNYYSKSRFTEISDGMTLLKNLQDVTVANNSGIDDLTQIAPGAFKGLKNLTEVTLNDALTRIGEHAFEGCSDLSAVHFGEGLKEIGNQAFYYCISLKEIQLNPKLKTIGNQAFSCCGFETLGIGEIASDEHYDPDEDKPVFGTDVFAYCSHLRSVTLGPKFTAVPEGMFEFCIFLEEFIYSDALTEIGAKAFKNCMKLSNLTFSYQLKTIGAEAFAGTKINGIFIPEWIEEIGDSAFCYNVESGYPVMKEDAMLYVTADSGALIYAINNGVPYEVNVGGVDDNIEWRYNQETKVLKIAGSGQMPAYTLQNQAQWASYEDEIETVIIGDGITSVARQGFLAQHGEYGKLKNVRLGTSVDTVGYQAFYNCPLKSVEIPASVVNIGKKAFGYLEDAYGDESVSEELTMCVEKGSEAENYAKQNGIDSTYKYFTGTTGDVSYAFDRDTATLTISGTGAMGDYRHSYDAPWYEFREDVRTVKIQEGVTSIGNRAFMRFKKLTKIFTPETLTKIGDYAFDGVNQLDEIYIPASVTSIGNCAIGFDSTYPDDDFQTGGRWINNRITLYSESADGAAFEYEENSQGPVAVHGRCGAVGECFWTFSYEDGCLTISGSGSFASETYPWESFSDDVQTIYLAPNAVIREIPDYAFADLRNLTYVSLNPYWGYIDTIGKGAFQDDVFLKSCEIPSGVTEIKEETFKGCASLNSFYPNMVRTIGARAFEECVFLTNVTFNDNLKEIGDRAFAVSGLETISADGSAADLPDSVKKIGEEAFYDSCLEEVELPVTVKEIGDRAFGFYDSVDGPKLVEEFVLIAPESSKAHKYAKKNGITWRDPYVGDLENIHWEYKPAGKLLVISGTGKIPADADAWKRFKNMISRIEFENGVTEIGERAFAGLCEPYGTDKPVELKLSGSIATIGKSAFEETCLGEVKLPIGVETIEEGAFRSTDPSKLTISRSVKEIGAYAFYGSWRAYEAGFKTVTIPPNVTTIGEYAFGFVPGNGPMLLPDFSVVGVTGSAAETYANAYSVPFTACAADEIFPPCSHTSLVLVEEIDPTETSEGRMAFYACEDCGEWFMDDEGTILIEDHKSVIIPRIMPIEPEPAAKLNYTKKTLKAGKTVTLKVTNGKVKSWKSSKSTVAKVTSKGVVTALKKGSATITVTLTSGEKLTCKITVSSSPTVTVGGKKFKSSTTYSVKKGKTLTVKITGRASSVANVYSTTKKTIAKVTTSSKKTSTVKIKGLKAGKATVTIKVNGVAFKIKVKVTK